MAYVYQIFGQLYKNSKEFEILVEEVANTFEDVDGLVSKTILSDIENETASALYLCKDRETALLAQERIKGILEKYDEHIGFTTEFIFKVIENAQSK